MKRLAITAAALLAGTISASAYTINAEEQAATDAIIARMAQAAVCAPIVGVEPYEDARNQGIALMTAVSGSRDFALILVAKIDDRIVTNPQLPAMRLHASPVKCKALFGVAS